MWPARQDPFSSYRPGFEVRTYRLCRRVLVFHTFAELGATPCLVASTDLGYDENPILTKLTSVTHRGYLRDPGGAHLHDAGAPAAYVRLLAGRPAHRHPRGRCAEPRGDPRWGRRRRRPGGSISTARASPACSSRTTTRSPTSATWAAGVLAPARTLPLRPRVANLSDARQQIVDLDGDGRKELAMWHYPMSGFHERTDDDGWTGWKPFRLQPMFNVDAPMVRFIDLHGRRARGPDLSSTT